VAVRELDLQYSRVTLTTTCIVRGAVVIEGEAQVKIGSSVKRAAKAAVKAGG
jgi:3-hydroxybutyryl-CoA dehydratase